MQSHDKIVYAEQYSKEGRKQYFASLKPNRNPRILEWLSLISEQQKSLLYSFNVNQIKVESYNLPFKKLDFINTVSSFYYKGKVGRRLDCIIYHDEIPLGIIQYSSPVLNSRLNDFLKCKYGEFNFSFLNHRVVDLSVCVPFGFLTRFLTGKLLVFVAVSKEVIEKFDQKYGTEIEVLFTTSIYGKSSMYNRVRNLKYLGLTEGYHSLLTDEQLRFIKEKYRQLFPHRKVKTSALSEHIIRLYLHLKQAGVNIPFEIPKMQKGVYVCEDFLPLEENLKYWYKRWFLPRRQRLLETNNDEQVLDKWGSARGQ